MINKLPPQAPELEQAVLGAILLEKTAFAEVENMLTPADFYMPANGLIYQAALNLSRRNYPVDMLTVAEELARMKKIDEAGGPVYVSQLTSGIGSTSHLEYHAQIVKEKAQARHLIRMAACLQEELYAPGCDVYQIQEKFEQQFTHLFSQDSHTQLREMGEVVHDAVQQAAHREELYKSGQHTAIPTGLAALDNALDGGWRPPDLIIIGGRPSMGKTQFALRFAKVAAQYDKKVFIASIEMSDLQLAGRYLMEDIRVNPSHFRRGDMTPEEWSALEETAGQLWNLPIHIGADHTISRLSHIRAQARRLKRRDGLDLLVIDHLGLIHTEQTFERRDLEIGAITRDLKNLAKELDIAVILVCQLKRVNKGFNIRIPQMDELRESGNIEQDADIVVFVHKPDYYDPDIEDNDGVPWKNRGQLVLAKQREGIRAINIVYHHDERYKNVW